MKIWRNVRFHVSRKKTYIFMSFFEIVNFPTICPNSKHVRYECNGSPSVDPNLLKSRFNITLRQINLNGNCFGIVLIVMIVQNVNIYLHNVLWSFFFGAIIEFTIFFFGETSNFRNGSTSGPGRHITSCSNSKHVR